MNDAVRISDAVCLPARSKLNGDWRCDPIDSAAKIVFSPFFDILDFDSFEISHAPFPFACRAVPWLAESVERRRTSPK
jgi:hypothetical protein